MSTAPWVEDRTPETTLPETQSRLDEFRQYSTVTKPPKAQEKGEVETHYHTLQTKLRLSNRPAYLPTEGKQVAVSVSVIKYRVSAETLCCVRVQLYRSGQKISQVIKFRCVQ